MTVKEIRPQDKAGWILTRQRLIRPTQEGPEYDGLFRAMAPVPTVYWCAPGSPPVLPHRAAFCDRDYTYRLRAQREIVKGRFQKGNIAYIFSDQWPLFAALYRKPLPAMNQEAWLLWDALQSEGPMSIGQMREVTGLKAKAITPALHRLQQAFAVFEDQADCEGDRTWFRLESEFPDVNLESYTFEEALDQLLPGMVRLNGFLDEAGLANVLALPGRAIAASAERLVEAGRLIPARLEGQDGYITAQDADEPAPEVAPSVFALDRNDFAVRCHGRALKDRFAPREGDVLYYLLVDGRFVGVITGRFHNGPFDPWDVELDMEKGEAQARKEEILCAVEAVLDPRVSPLKAYQGERLP